MITMGRAAARLVSCLPKQQQQQQGTKWQQQHLKMRGSNLFSSSNN